MSKIIKLSESDLINLVKKVLREQDENQDALQQINSQLVDTGIPTLLDQEDIVDLQSVENCPIEEPEFKNPQDSETFQQLVPQIEKVKENLKTMKLGQVLRELKNLFSRMKNKPKKMNEQAETIMIAGAAIPAGALMIVGGVIAILLLSKLISLIIGITKGDSDCKRKHRLFQRFGPAGVV